jgi:acetyl esterase/lipase
MRIAAALFVLLSAVALTSSLSGQDANKTVFGVDIHKAIAYKTGKDADPLRHKLDLYLPKGKKDFTVLFYVHGGGWTKGSKKSAARLGQAFAERGTGTVATNYRLTPQVQHPGHIQDVARAFAWTYRNISKYGGRPERIFISGHSAGGHLVALLATNDSYLKAEGLGLDRIRGAIPVSGVYRIGPKLGKVFGDAESCRQASPLDFVNGTRPPFLLLYAEKDIPACDKLSQAMADRPAKVQERGRLPPGARPQSRLDHRRAPGERRSGGAGSAGVYREILD